MGERWRLPAGEGGPGAAALGGADAGGADAVPLRVMLVEGARRMGLEHPVETAKVFASWRELVGEQVAARCDPAGLSRGVLKVWAATPTWASELRYLAPEVIRRVNAGVGAAVVREVKVSLRPASADRREGVERNTRGPARGRPGGSGGPRAGQAAAGSGASVGLAGPRAGAPVGAGLDADELVRGIGDERLAAATKRALLAAKTHPKNW